MHFSGLAGVDMLWKGIPNQIGQIIEFEETE
jgi:hypothetical protein